MAVIHKLYGQKNVQHIIGCNGWQSRSHAQESPEIWINEANSIHRSLCRRYVLPAANGVPDAGVRTKCPKDETPDARFACFDKAFWALALSFLGMSEVQQSSLFYRLQCTCNLGHLVTLPLHYRAGSRNLSPYVPVVISDVMYIHYTHVLWATVFNACQCAWRVMTTHTLWGETSRLKAVYPQVW